MSKVKMYFGTIKHLKPIQIVSRIKSQLSSDKKPELSSDFETEPIHLFMPDLDEDEEYIRRFSPDSMLNGKILLLNQMVDIDFSEFSKKSMSPLLWYNLQYFEYAIPLGGLYRKTNDSKYRDAFIDAYQKYINADLPYSPYVISLHIPNLIIALELFESDLPEEFLRRINEELYRQFRFLTSHLETQLLGNHYFENIKAIIIAARYFQKGDIFNRYCQRLSREIEEQILPDGMHFELSPMYHKIILEDLLRLGKVIDQRNNEWLRNAIQKALDALVTLEQEISRTPLFNDSGDNVAKRWDQLTLAAKRVYGFESHRTDSLPFAGYYFLADGNVRLIEDIGKIGPDYMPGHGHCDCLSFELYWDGTPVFVNSGTFQYQGNKRQYFRSTASHNTIVMDGNEQSLCWGEHRVAQRIKDVFAEKKQDCLVGRYKNQAGQKHERVLRLLNNTLTVFDSTEGAKHVKSFLHVSNDFRVNSSLQLSSSTGNKHCKIRPINCEYTLHRSGELCQYAPEFGLIYDSTCIEFYWDADDTPHGYEIEFLKEK